MTDAELLTLARSGGDCTAELQSRIAVVHGGGVVNLPNGSAVYKTTDTLTLGLGVSLFGPPGACVIDYHGPASLPAIRIDRNWGYRLQGVSVRRHANDQQGVGIEIVPDPAANVPPLGTCSGNSHWDQVSVFGFATGAQLGSPVQHYATSELTFTQCQFCNNDTGIRLSDFNTLNIVCINLGISNNRVGLLADTGGRVTVIGGSASINTEQDFRIRHAHGCQVTGFRSEGANTFFRGPEVSAPSVVTLTNCVAFQRGDAPEPTVVFTAAGRCGMYQCHILGRAPEFWSNGGAGNVTMDGCAIQDTRPLRVICNAGTQPCRVETRGCSQVDEGNGFVRRFADWQGLFGPEGWNNVADPYEA